MAGRFISIATSLVILISIGQAQNDEIQEILGHLKARENSITNFEIKLRRASFHLESDDVIDIEKAIQTVAEKDDVTDTDTVTWAEELVRTWSKKNSWMTEHIHQRDQCFKQTRISNKGKYVDVEVYDGQLYYDYRQINRQLDIHPKIPNIAHVTLSAIGLSAKGLCQGPEQVSVKWNTDGSRCVISKTGHEFGYVTYEYDRHLGLRRLQYEGDPTEYFLFHKDVDGYSIPRVKIRLSRNPRNNTCWVQVRIIEQIRLNGPMTDKDLALGDLPDSTLVIDYRFTPNRQWRWSEYCQSATNPDRICTGQADPKEFIEFLDRTSGQRKAHAVRNSRIGRQAPPLHVQGWLTRIPKLDTWPPDRFTVLNFCGISCGFCLHEFPDNKELAQWLTDQGTQFLAIHAARNDPLPVINVLDQNHVGYFVGLDESSDQAAFWNSATFAEYGIIGIPAYVTIAQDGRVLSYDRTLTKERLSQLMATDPNEMVGQDVQTPASIIPSGWLVRDLEPKIDVQSRFFIYRPETPDLTLLRPETSDNSLTCNWTLHRTETQAVYEVHLSAQAPDPGQTLKGHLTLLARYNNREEPITIPYELHANNIE